MKNILIFTVFSCLAFVALINPPHQRALAHLAMAEERVADAMARGGTALDLSDLFALRRLPANIGAFTALEHLNLRGTDLADLSGLEGHGALRHLDLSFTWVADLTPLTGLEALREVHLQGAWVSDLAPLTTLPALERLDMAKTQISTLAPLIGAERLTWLNLNESHALDGSQGVYGRLSERVELEIQGGAAFDLDYRAGWPHKAMRKLSQLREQLYL